MRAKVVLSKSQKFILILFAVIFTAGLVVDYHITIISLLTILTFFYFVHILISFYLTYKSVFEGSEIKIDDNEIKAIEREWPKYTILCPLYKESNILPIFVGNINKLEYPTDRLECLLLLEEDDAETMAMAAEMRLPSYFKIVVIPNSIPKTKPKACNVGLSQASGEYLVIYDAEDRPDPFQLKKSVLAFENMNDKKIVCVQAKLNYFNPRQNFLTRMFAAEYTLWFDLILPGLQSISAPIPLGGTSNHFKTEILKKLDGWDSYNVTEDCDLGIRLKSMGYETIILDSVTWEEANSDLKNWIRQRSRWIKGYFQTFLVFIRNPFSLLSKIGLFNFLLFFLLTGFMPFASLINPFLWLTTILYFVFRPTLGPIIEQFYPGFILYPAVFCLVVGNFLYVYNYVLGIAKRGEDSLLKFGLLMPFYWVLISIAGWYGFIQLIIKPHFWEKTKHGLNKEGSNA